jgi:hypothetical protein
VAATLLVAGTGTPSQIPACSVQFHTVFCFINETLEVTAKEKTKWGQGRGSHPPPHPGRMFSHSVRKTDGTPSWCNHVHRLPVSYPMPISVCGYVSDHVVPISNYCALTPLQPLVGRSQYIQATLCRREPHPDLLILLPAACSTAYPSHVAPSYQLASVAWKPLIFVGDVEFPPFCAPILILQRRVRALPRGRCDNVLIITEPLQCSQASEVQV